MRIAKDIKGYGMTCSTELQHNIATLIAEETITRVVETGSYLGLGTTKAVLKGMKLHGMDYEFISIEVNPDHHAQAEANNIGTKVQFLNGLSIPKILEPVNITFDVPDHVIVDHAPGEYHKYLNETKHRVPDDMLKKACKIKPELVILDSAGYVGFIEFKYLMELIPSDPFWLVLDDIGHVKHYTTMMFIKEHPERFEVIWESSDDELHRAAIIKANVS
jgi:hypothetical protein